MENTAQQPPFIPGRPTPPCPPLARYRPTQPVGAVGRYVQALTRPGDLVVDLFCQGPAVMRETVTAGRRALGLSVNPLLLVATRLGLDRRNQDALNAAFTRLADSPKRNIPLRRHLASLYNSACPACGTPGAAEWFAWDRDENNIFRKAVRCVRCGKLQEGVPDSQDLQAARRIRPRGLAYYYALDRVAPPGHPARERAAEIVELYTPRNLSALMDLSMRLEGLESDRATKTALTGLLLDCFDGCSKLDPYGEGQTRPHQLRPPSRYLERNVWLYLERGFARLLASEEQPAVQHTTDVAGLVNGQTTGYALVAHAARDVRRVIRPGSAALIFINPPRPDGPFWALSALWAGWLWESPVARALRPFLSRRRFDWDWHRRVLQAALKATGPLLTPTGHLITLFSDPEESLLESVCLAAGGAGYTLVEWGYSAGVGHRLIWRWEAQKTEDNSREAWDEEQAKQELRAAAESTVLSTLRERGEPAARATLHTCAYAGLTERGLLARLVALPKSGPSARSLAADAIQSALDSISLVQVTGQDGDSTALWWLAEPDHVAQPLADRVDEMVWESLVRQANWEHEELVNAVYANFPGPLTPDLKLVLTCIDSYSVREGERLHLRPEDEPLRRAAELGALRNDLIGLGKRLGFEVRQDGSWDVRWLEEGRQVYVFAISTTTALSRHLLARREASAGAQRCLVLPGGRAQLVGLRLRRDPRLAHAVESEGWQFIKFRHLRRLVAEEELNRHAIKTVLGLDPIVEQEAAQIPLF